MPRKKKPDPERYCASCGKLMARKKFNTNWEDRTRFLLRKYCDRKCMAKGQMKAVLTRSGYLVRARVHLKSRCERCGTTQKLSVHHIDRDWSNNDTSNLQTLCTSCHTSLHHARGEIVPRRKEKLCKYCERPCLMRSVCNTCRTRIRKHGDPYFGRKEWISLCAQRRQQKETSGVPAALKHSGIRLSRKSPDSSEKSSLKRKDG